VSLGPCTHLVVTGTLNPAPRELDGTECAYRPTWLPGPPGRLAFLMPKNGSRLAFVRSIDDSSPAKAWDDRPGVTYQIAAAIDGGLFELRAEPGAPRSIWHVSAVGSNDRKLLFAPLSADVVRRVAPRVEQVSVRAADGLDVPLVLFQPATTGPTTRSPVVVWVHGGRDAGGDISPRWYNEIAYLTAAGAVVVAVNYRGSTGYGGAFRARAAERDAQVTDLYAAADYARRLPGVDPSRLFWFAESAAGALVGRGAGAAEAAAANVGFVQWTGADLAASAEALPGGASLLWIRGRWDAAAPTFANLEARLRARAVRFDVLSFARESHALYWGDDRAAALERVRSFVGL
jgi:acetyl esterase/lipase